MTEKSLVFDFVNDWHNSAFAFCYFPFSWNQEPVNGWIYILQLKFFFSTLHDVHLSLFWGIYLESWWGLHDHKSIIILRSIPSYEAHPDCESYLFVKKTHISHFRQLWRLIWKWNWNNEQTLIIMSDWPIARQTLIYKILIFIYFEHPKWNN